MSDQTANADGAGAMRQVAAATGLVSLMALCSRLLGFVRDATIAALFGQGATVDAYRYGFKIPDLLWMLVLGGVMYAAYVPVVTAYLAKGEDDEAWSTFSIIATLLFCLLSVVVPLAWVFAEPLLCHVLAPGLAPETLALAVRLTRIVLPAQYCFFLGGLMMGMLQAHQRFLIPTIGPLVYNLGIIFGGVLLHRHLGIAGFAWGAVAGAFLGNFLLQVWGVRRIGGRFRPSLNLRHEGVRKCGRLALPVICGISLPQVDSTINGIVVAGITGGMAILENTNRLMQLPLGIVGQALGIAILPTLSAQAAANDLPRFRDLVNFGVRLALFLTVPLAVSLMVLARPVLAVVFERGQFTAVDTQHAVPALVLYSLGIGAYAAQAIVARAYYARHDTWTPVLCGSSVTLFVFVPLNFLLFYLMQDPERPWLSTRGPALATATGATCNFLLLFAVLHRRLGGIGLRRIGLALARVAVGCLVLAGLEYAVSQLVTGHLHLGRRGALVELLGGAVGLGGYLLVTARLGSEEAAQVIDLTWGRLRRRRAGGRPRQELAG